MSASASMPNRPPQLQRSKLVSREALFQISGGKTFPNLLGLPSPVVYCGGPAIASKGEIMSHICLKETMNEGLTGPEYQLHKCGNASKPPRGFRMLKLYVGKETFPFFWQPLAQKGTFVQYVGHWKVANVQSCSFVYNFVPRCGTATLKLDHFSESFAAIINNIGSPAPIPFVTPSHPLRRTSCQVSRRLTRQSHEHERPQRTTSTDIQSVTPKRPAATSLERAARKRKPRLTDDSDDEGSVYSPSSSGESDNDSDEDFQANTRAFRTMTTQATRRSPRRRGQSATATTSVVKSEPIEAIASETQASPVAVKSAMNASREPLQSETKISPVAVMSEATASQQSVKAESIAPPLAIQLERSKSPSKVKSENTALREKVKSEEIPEVIEIESDNDAFLEDKPEVIEIESDDEGATGSVAVEIIDL